MSCQVDYNTLLGNECQGIFFEPTNASLNKDIDIIGNIGGSYAFQCDGFIGINWTGGGAHSDGGTWNIGFNESPAAFSTVAIPNDWQPGSVVNFYGNYLNSLREWKTCSIVNGQQVCTFPTTTCTFSTGTGAPDPNVTYRYQYNVWRTGSACDATDTTGTTPGAVNSAPAPAVGLDMHKTGALGVADNFVVCANLTIGTCPAVDIDGQALAATADAGADQR
jgi:hypothetical protein